MTNAISVSLTEPEEYVSDMLDAGYSYDTLPGAHKRWLHALILRGDRSLAEFDLHGYAPRLVNDYWGSNISWPALAQKMAEDLESRLADRAREMFSDEEFERDRAQRRAV